MVTAMPPQRRGLTVLLATVFVDQVGFGILLPFLPLYAKTFGASGFEVGLLLAVYSAMQMLVSTWWGRLSDRVGRRPVIVASAAGTCMSFVILGLAPTLPVVFVGRALLGSVGVGYATAQALVADTTPPEDRGRVMGLVGAFGGLGFVLGPAIGALGILIGGMRLPFFVSAACAAGNAVLAGTLLPYAAPVAAAGRARMRGAWRPIAPCLIVAFVLTYAFSNIEATFAMFTRTELGLGPADNGWLFVAMGSAAALTQGVALGPLARRLDDAHRVAFGLLILAGGAAALPLATTVAILIAPLTAMAIGFAIVSPSLIAWVSRRSPADRQGEMLGLAQSTSALARVAGPGIGGLVFDHVGHASPFRIAAVVIAGAALTALATRSA
jgi:DHA1 family tetracycline resistance protein-like MFS transporter